MANDFKPVILAALGEPPPPERAEREAVYARIQNQLAAMVAGDDAAAERLRLALQQEIDAVEAELAAAASAPGPAATAPAVQTPPAAALQPFHKGKIAAAVIVLLAMLGAGAWYLVPFGERSERAADVSPPPPPALSDKAKSFQEAMRNADAATTAFLIQSGFRPTRVELREALLTAQFTPNIKAATEPLAADIHAIACTFTTYLDVRKPIARASLFDAEDAFAVMKQIGQEQWKALCASEKDKWREALKRIEERYAQYNKPDIEKKDQALACIKRFSEAEATSRWEQANCPACPEGHSNCESYCPQAPKPADAEEARFFSFNRSDMLMAGIASRRTNASRAELFCNMQYLTRATDFDLANLQRFKALAGLFE